MDVICSHRWSSLRVVINTQLLNSIVSGIISTWWLTHDTVTMIVGYFTRPIIFMNKTSNANSSELVKPTKYGLTRTQNITLQSDEFTSGDKVRGWWIHPDDSKDGQYDMDGRCGEENVINIPRLGPYDTVVVHLHGRSKNRGTSHAIAAYKHFQKQGYHTLAMDYRGFGDSPMHDMIKETTVVQDVKLALRFVRERVGGEAKLIIYAHSLGTAIATRSAVECTRDKIARVDGIILDSPFHSSKEMLLNNYWYGKPMSWILDVAPHFRLMHCAFETVKWLAQLTIPVTIFHATDDKVAPIILAHKLVEDVEKMGKYDVNLVVWEDEGLGHNGIPKTPEFPKEIRKFVVNVHRVCKRPCIRRYSCTG